jgi:hypothetical protein
MKESWSATIFAKMGAISIILGGKSFRYGQEKLHSGKISGLAWIVG